MHFGSWDAAKEWSVSMPVGEDIQVQSVTSVLVNKLYMEL